jgi:hypothetical protein
MHAQVLMSISMFSYMQSKKMLEINHVRLVIVKIVEQLETDDENKSAKDDSFFV